MSLPEEMEDEMDDFLEDDEILVSKEKKKKKKDKKEKKEKKEKKAKKRKRAYDDDESSGDAVDLANLGEGMDEDSSETSDFGREMEGSGDEEEDNRDDAAIEAHLNRNKGVPSFLDRLQEREAKGVIDDDEESAISVGKLGEGDEEDDFDGALMPTTGYAGEGQDQDIQGKYPTIADPKLFMVRVKGGFGRTLCAQLMYKCLARAVKGEDLMIKSVFCRDHLSEYIYVEAYRQAHVLNAISGLHGAWRNKITLIPVGEMPSTLARIKAPNTVKAGSWGRFRYGLHKGDICKIVEVDDSKECYVIEVVPRIDFAKLLDPENHGGATEGGFRVQKLKTKTRPLQRFFTDVDFRKAQGARPKYDSLEDFENEQQQKDPNQRESSVRVLGKNFSFSGHEIKTVRQQAVNTERTKVNLQTDELIRFEQGRVPATRQEIKRLREIREVDLIVGDRVRVTAGELKNTVGYVKEIYTDATGSKYKVLPINSALLQEAIPLTRDDLAKVIAEGAHVKIIAGGHVGETGMVVRASPEKGTVHIFSKRNEAEYEVFMSDVKETQELASNIPVFGQFEVYELVKLRGTVAGMITKIENGQFTVLNNLGKEILVNHAELQDVLSSTRQSLTRKGRRQLGLDRYGNEICQDDIVKVVSDKSEWEGKEAVVKHIFMDSVWLEAKGVSRNMGFFVLTRTELWLVGGARTRQDLSLDAYEKPPTGARAADPTLEVIEEEGNAKKRRRLERDQLTLVGKRVRVLKGYQKGYLGIVTAVHGDMARVEMHTGELGLTVPVAHLAQVDLHDSLATSDQVEMRNKVRKAQVRAAGGQDLGAGAGGDRAVVGSIDRFSDANTEIPEWASNISGLQSSLQSGSRAGSRASGVLSLASAGTNGSRKRPSRRLGSEAGSSSAHSVRAASLAASSGYARASSLAPVAPTPLLPAYPWWAVEGAAATHDGKVVRLQRYVDNSQVWVREKGTAVDKRVNVAELEKYQATEADDGVMKLVALDRPEAALVAIESPCRGIFAGYAGDEVMIRKDSDGTVVFTGINNVVFLL